MATETRADKAARERLRSYEARKQTFEAQGKRRRRDNALYVSLAAAVVIVAVGAQVLFSLTQEPVESQQSAASSTKAPTESVIPDKTIAEGRTWSGVMSLNDSLLGFELDGAAAPQAVSSEIYLIKRGFYNDLSCHRLTTEGIFVLQCGDPQGDGTGGPGFSYGPIENAPQDDFYPAGTIAMARQGGNASSQGSQFFIVYKDSTIPSDIAGGYTVIGHVTSGLDGLVNYVINGGVSGGGTDGVPATPVKITGITVQ